MQLHNRPAAFTAHFNNWPPASDKQVPHGLDGATKRLRDECLRFYRKACVIAV
jgi:hypothetical protein